MPPLTRDAASKKWTGPDGSLAKKEDEEQRLRSNANFLVRDVNSMQFQVTFFFRDITANMKASQHPVLTFHPITNIQ